MAESNPQEGIWCHIEIPAQNVERCKGFYGEVFGWQFQEIPEMGYTMYSTREGGIGGGICDAKDSHGSMVNYVLVDDIEATIQRTENNGGSVVVPRTEVPGAGWLAHLKDPEGNTFGIWKSAEKA